MLGTYFGGYGFYFIILGVYCLVFVRADFISRLLLLLFTFAMLLGLFSSFGMTSFFPASTLLMERLLLSFFSLFDLLSAFLFSFLLPFFGSIDL